MINRAFPNITSAVEQGIDDNYQKVPSLDNLHRGFYGTKGKTNSGLLMDIHYVASTKDLSEVNAILEEDVADIFLQEAEAPAAEEPLVDQLRSIAASPRFSFSVGLDAGRYRHARQLSRSAMSLSSI